MVTTTTVVLSPIFTSENPLLISGPLFLIFFIYRGTMILVNLLEHSAGRQLGVFTVLIFAHLLLIYYSLSVLLHLLHLPLENHFSAICAIHRLLHFYSE
jgi:hypothetical protein